MSGVANKVLAYRVLFWTVAILLLFFRLGSTAPWQSEDRWLEVAREMIASGNYFKPTINGVIYFDKPLLSYWFVLLTSTLTSGVNEWAMRIPSAIAAWIALWATVDLGRRLWSEQTGYLAGWILLTSFGFLQWGRLAEADMENLAFTIVAVLWYWRRRDSPGFFGYATFYLIIAVGAQCKGLTAVIVPLLALLPDMLTKQRWRLHLNSAHFFAMLLACAIYTLPFLLASDSTTHTVTTAGHSSGIGMVIRENVLRYFAPFDHTGPIYTYLMAIPQFMLPWSFVVIAALLASSQKSFRTQANVPWVLWTFVLIFAFFTLSGSRRGYYILPILPYCALLSARFLHDTSCKNLRKLAINLSLALVIVFSVLQILIAALWLSLERHLHTSLPEEFRMLCLMVGVISLGCVLFVLWKYRAHSDKGVIAITVSAVLLWGGFFGWQQVAMDQYRSEVPFARKLKLLADDLPAGQVVIYRKQPSGKLLYYSGLALPIQELDDANQLQQFLDTAPYPKLILVDTRWQDELPESLRHRSADLVETHYGWEKDTRDKMQAWRINALASHTPATQLP